MRDVTDISALSVVTIAQVMPETGWRPDIAQRGEARLPSTDEQRGIGTNTTDVFLIAPMLKQPGEVFVVADVGLGIRAVRADSQTQDDVLPYDVAAARKASRRRMLSDELVERRASSGGRVGTADRSSLLARTAWASRPNSVGLTLSLGLLRDGVDLGVMLAVSHGFRVYNRVRAD